MDIIQRYNKQKQSFFLDNTYNSIQDYTNSYIDNYILTIIKTSDKRRLLIDKNEYNNIINSLVKDLNRTIEKDMKSLCKQFR
jgi:hypothetical protein